MRAIGGANQSETRPYSRKLLTAHLHEWRSCKISLRLGAHLAHLHICTSGFIPTPPIDYLTHLPDSFSQMQYPCASEHCNNHLRNPKAWPDISDE
jgi:hypothetical protein